MKRLAPLGPGGTRAPRQPLSWRLQRWISNWLPLALLALLAVFTTWLVKLTPVPGGPTGELVPRSKPDYEMRGFELQRFAPGGATEAWLRGDALRHYPEGDRIEIDRLRLRAVAEDGSVLLAEAASSSGPLSGSQLTLSGGVLVRRYAPGAEPETATPLMQLKTDELLAERNGQVLSTRSAAQVISRGSVMDVHGFRYEHAKGLLRFGGPSRIVLQPGPPR